MGQFAPVGQVVKPAGGLLTRHLRRFPIGAQDAILPHKPSDPKLTRYPIVQYRERHGAFKDWREIANVDGVDPKKIEAKKDVIEL